MTIAGISSNVSIFAARGSAHEKSAIANMIYSAEIGENSIANSPAAIVDISEPAKQMAQALPEHKNEEKIDGSLKLTDILFSPEIQKAAHDRIIEITTRPTDPFAYEDLMRSMKYDFRPGSSEDIMNSTLEGKAINSSVVANELSTMLRQTVTGKELSVEQRAENRESALKCAQFIANKYLNSDEKGKFMSAVNKLYSDDIMTDKGYYEIEPDKWVRNGSSWVGGKLRSPDYRIIGFDRAYRKAHGIESTYLYKIGSPEHTEYIHALTDFLSNATPEEKAEMESYGKKLMDDKENAVDRATFKAKNNFNRELFNNNISRLLKAFEPKAS